MMRFAADENFNGRLLRALKTRVPDVDIVRVQDTEMYQVSDPNLLVWLAQESRVLLTHDVKTMPKYFYERINNGLSNPGIIEIRESMPMGYLLDELEVLLGAGKSEDFRDLIIYVPL